jgi:hypothetical protein
MAQEGNLREQIGEDFLVARERRMVARCRLP